MGRGEIGDENVTTTADRVTTTALSHLSVRYRPGDRHNVKALFELLGFGVDDQRPDVMMIRIDSDDTGTDYLNRIAVWEMTPEQLRFEVAFRSAASDGPLASAIADYEESTVQDPDRAGHFGIRTRSRDDLDRVVARIEQLAGSELGARVKVKGWCHPGDANSHSNRFDQAFIWTDLFAPGFIGSGIVFELQHLHQATPA
jgi:hypothetical protein